MIRKYLLPLAAVGLLLFAVLYVVRGQQTTPPSPPPGQPSITPFHKTVAGAGIVEAQTENIAIGSPLPGVVLEVFIPRLQIGMRVKKGTPLFRVDDRALKAQLAYQEASLAAAEAQLAKLEAMPRKEELPPSLAKVRNAQANVDLMRDQYERAQRLFPRSMSEEEYRQRRLAWEGARQQLAQAQAEYDLLKAGAWKPDKDIARAQIALVQSQIQQTRVDLERATVRAPVDGVVLQLNVRPGEYVGTPPNQALVVLGSLQQLHVRVDIDEHDIPRFRPGAPARAMLRGNPDKAYPLTFVRVEPYVIPKKSLAGDNTERVNTLVMQVIYALPPGQEGIYVGHQMDVFIDTAGTGAPAGSPPR